VTRESVGDQPSLEGLVETGMLKLEGLHPGGLETTKQLIESCGIQPGSVVRRIRYGRDRLLSGSGGQGSRRGGRPV